jgi:hypothetical protein
MTAFGNCDRARFLFKAVGYLASILVTVRHFIGDADFRGRPALSSAAHIIG